jgi:probable F420-dependent oxidoreductase
VKHVMRLGFGLPVAGAWATPENMLAVAREAESLGYHSLWTLQRILYASAPRNEYASAPGGSWPAYFESVADALVTLGYVAAATSRIRLGTAVVNLPYYSPVLLAKQLATLDVVSGGRLTVGAGVGWSEDEYAAAGVPFRRRGRRMDECLRCLKLVWAEELVEFRGEFYEIPASRIDPKPVQRPHPPLLVGGYSDAAVRRAVSLADGYIGGNVPLAELAPVIERVRCAARDAGRDPDGVPIVARGAVSLRDEPTGRGRRPLFGSLEEVREDVERYWETGLTELFLDLNFDERIAAPGADPDAAMGVARRLLAELAPSS